jgi:nicotinate-nucleotide adenylyltransferase
MKVGLYFGSFNPIHIGHLIIANHVANLDEIDQVWFIVSPQNPLKSSKTLLNEYHRLHLVQQSIENNPLLRASEVEFKLPRPSFTIDTLTYLNERYPHHQFSLIIGSDSYNNIHHWKNSGALLKMYEILVYIRPNHPVDTSLIPANIKLLKAPLLEISSTEIRQLVKAGKSIQYLVPEGAREEIEKNNYYK